MAERIDLTTAYPPPPAQTSQLHVMRLDLNWGAASIVIELRDSATGITHPPITYEGAIATTLMLALNVANLSTKSLHKRVLERLIADGKLAGTIAGTPD